ncbi:methyltransferase domain-containing protein [Terasakiella pusilla]|uniref:methyltransferase domain-containing protein n=1 Tax=Terasakiella pusilla TaxID=64973 RepID=UPI003AA9AA87
MTLIKDALQLISAGFTIQLDEHGATPLGVLWKDGREQIERFEFLCRIIDDQLDHCTINDLGCGYGAFFSFLKDKPYMKNGRFFGYDICPEMIEKAQNMHGSDDRAFFEILPFPNNMADYSFASGTFNMRATASEESWTEFVKTSICEMYNKSKRGVAFNLLSQNNAQEEWLYYADVN